MEVPLDLLLWTCWWWQKGKTYGIEAFGSLSVDCHDFDMVPQVSFMLPPLELLTSSLRKVAVAKLWARLSFTTPVPPIHWGRDPDYTGMTTPHFV